MEFGHCRVLVLFCFAFFLLPFSCSGQTRYDIMVSGALGYRSLKERNITQNGTTHVSDQHDPYFRSSVIILPEWSWKTTAAAIGLAMFVLLGPFILLVQQLPVVADRLDLRLGCFPTPLYESLPSALHEKPHGECAGCQRPVKTGHDVDGKPYTHCCLACARNPDAHDASCGKEVQAGYCIMGCGRNVRPGTTRNGHPYTTCCKQCASSGGDGSHDETCGATVLERLGKAEPGFCEIGCGRRAQRLPFFSRGMFKGARSPEARFCCSACSINKGHNRYCGVLYDEVCSDLKREVAYVLALPWVTAVVLYIVAVALGAEVAKYTAFALMACISCRAAYRDAAFANDLAPADKKTGTAPCQLAFGDLGKIPKCPFFLTKAEVVDAISDGAALSHIIILSRSTHIAERFVYTWAQGGDILQQCATVLNFVGLSGCMAASLAGATLAQAIVAAGSADDIVHSVRADMAGLGVTADVLDDWLTYNWFDMFDKTGNILQIYAEERLAKKTEQLTIGRILSESLPQLVWQSSALMATGEKLSTQPVLVASLTITLGLTAKKGVDLVRRGFIPPQTFHLRMGGDEYFPRRWDSFLYGLVIVGLCVYFFVRLVMTEICPEHAWNFTPHGFDMDGARAAMMRGCVAFPAPLHIPA